MSEAGNSGPDNLEKHKAGAYRVLARKYRPSNFSELIGQEPMVRTLTNAFATGRIAQAWMLTGVRGVGKTTTARILARALNYKTATVDQPSVERLPKSLEKVSVSAVLLVARSKFISPGTGRTGGARRFWQESG